MVEVISSAAVATRFIFVEACSLAAATELMFELISSAADATVFDLAEVRSAPLKGCLKALKAQQMSWS
jgi:hypothetical protein